MPGEDEEENENKKAGADQDLDEAEDGDEPVEKWFSQEPIRNHADDRDRLEDRQARFTMLGSLSW